MWNILFTMLPDNATFMSTPKSANPSANNGSWMPMMYLNDTGAVNIAGLLFFGTSLVMITLTIVHHYISIKKMKSEDDRLSAVEQQLKEMQMRKGLIG